MKKWVFRILIFGFLFVCVGFSIATVVLNWRDFFNLEFLLGLSTILFFWFVLSIPLWIRAASIRHWRTPTKKVSIAIMVTISAGVTIYGNLRPHPSSSLNWVGQLALGLYFIATIASAWFNWPGRSKKNVKMLVGTPKRRYVRKNRTLIIIPKMTGTDGDATVTFINATFQKVNETKKRYPDPDFGFWLIEEIYKSKKVLAVREGTFKKKFFCSSCDTELNPDLREPKQIEYQLNFMDFDPFVVQIKIPSVACPQCSRICGIDLDGSLNNHLNEAIIAAFNSENIKP